ncbi:MAG: hypothetical protein Q7I97_08630 [Thermovirgaceae bacterium]|nr:hypothetical protein [Thermovirgaceae bacterium]
MSLTRILGKNHLANILRMPDVIDAVESAYVAHFAEPSQTLASSTAIEGIKAGFSLNSVLGFSAALNTAAISVAATKQGPSSSSRNSYFSSVFLLFDSENGELQGIFDGREITLLRAAAASAIAARLFARKDEKTMLLIGSGSLATSMVKGSAYSLPSLKQILVTGRDPRRSEHFVLTQSIRYPHLRFLDFPIFDLQEHALNSRYIVTASASETPFLKKEWLLPGTHITAAGANSPLKQELDQGIISSSGVFVDDKKQAALIGECRVAVESGLIGYGDMTEIGGVLAGKSRGRRGEDQVTVFDMTGNSLEDIMVGRLALKRAAYRNTGEVLEIIREPDTA